MSSLDLVLIHPGNSKRIYQGLSSAISGIEPPVWASLLAEYARRKGFSVAVIDAEAEGLAAEHVAERIASLQPRLTTLVVYGHQPSASTQNMTECSRIARAIKEATPTSPLLMLGGHVAALPDRTLEDEPADFICTGEGPVTLSELLQALSLPVPDFSKVRGLGYRDEGRVRFTPAAPLLENLDEEMPSLAWDLLDMSRYRAHNWHCFQETSRMPYASLYTTLGCPYHCSFCCIQAPFKSGEQALGMREGVNSYRFWSPATVIAQIDHLVKEYGVKNIKFADEMFVLKRDHVLGICRLIRERGYDLNIWAYARVDTIKPDMLEEMRAAGIRWLVLGIESGNARVRQDVGKGLAQPRVQSSVEALRAAGIYTLGNYIFGLPEDDLASMQETLDLAVDLNCEFANFYCGMAYPGSRLYADALRNDWPLPSDWAGFSQHSQDTLPLPTRYLSGGQVLAFRDQAFQTYFSNPRYLDMVAATFGPAVQQEIVSMMEHKLVRNFAEPLRIAT